MGDPIPFAESEFLANALADDVRYILHSDALPQGSKGSNRNVDRRYTRKLQDSVDDEKQSARRILLLHFYRCT